MEDPVVGMKKAKDRLAGAGFSAQRTCSRETGKES
jgi:hypothetical protein